MSLSPVKIRSLVESGNKTALILQKLKDDTHKTIITISLLNKFVDMAASAMITVMITAKFGNAAVGLAAGLVTFVSLIFGEILPKSFASTYAKPFALFSAWPLYFLSLILTPIIWFFDKIIKLALFLTGSKNQEIITDEEILALANMGAEEGAIEEEEREFIENVLEFNDIRIDELMTPRVHMDVMPEDFDLYEATDYVVNHTHSRIPVYRETTDHIVGILSVKELLRYVNEEEKPDEVTLRNLELQRPLKVPASMKAQQLFTMFKNEKSHIAIVLDEHGGTAGLITMEDLLEELVGDIMDEEDEEEHVRQVNNVTWEISGRTEIDELEEIFGKELELPDYKTVNYLASERMKGVPRVGQSFIYEGWEFEVSKMHRNTILKFKIQKLKDELDHPEA